jgi:ABC-type amino acid transport system permease subunit
MTPFQVFRHVVLPQALKRDLAGAVVSQIVIVMLGSAVVSQIAVRRADLRGEHSSSRAPSARSRPTSSSR